MLHASYIHFPITHNGHVADTGSVLVLEETTAPLGPLSNLNDPNPTVHSDKISVFVTSSTPIHLATHPAIPATIYHLGLVGYPNARADELVWTSNSLTIRLLVGITTSLREYATEPSYSGGQIYAYLDSIDEALFWDDPNDAMLQQVAISVASFACPT